jgi:hypothetical protein
VDDVLGVMECNRRRGASGVGLVRDERIVEMVETIGLGGGAVAVDLDRLDARVGNGSDCGGGRRIVAIMADENAIIGIVEASERCPKHRRDHGGFVPGGDEHHDEARVGIGGKCACEGARVARVNSQRAPQATREIDEVDQKVVDREQQEAGAREQGKLRRDAAEDDRQSHGGRLS